MLTLITGNKGFIGSHLHKLLPDAIGLDLKDYQDIRDELPDKPFTHIFHLAACKSVPLGEQIPRDFISTNCWGTVNLLKTYPNARILNISSSSANEVKSIYGATKLFGELAARTHSNCTSVRLYNVFGEGQLPESGAVVPNFIKSMIDGVPATIYGDGYQERDMTYVGDVVENLVRIMYDKPNIRLIHLGYSEPISIIGLHNAICRMEPNFEPDRIFDMRNSCSPEGMTIKYGRDEGIRRTIEWFKSEYYRARIS